MPDLSYWDGKPVLVPGGAGFIGGRLVEKLVSANASVTVPDLMVNGRQTWPADFDDKVERIREDVQSIDWEGLLVKREIQVIFMMAGNAYVPFSVDQPCMDFNINIGAIFRLLETLRKIRWPGILIFPSSGAVYGNPRRMPIREEDPTEPISPYGVSKLAAERYIAVYSQLYGLRSASVRPFSVYGPHQRKLVVYDLIKKIHENTKEIQMFGDGSQQRDFVYVEDVVRAMLLIAERGALQGEVYNLASGLTYSIGDLVKCVCEILGVRPRMIYSGAVRPGEPEKWSVDISKLQNLGYLPKISLLEGLKRTIAWFQFTYCDRMRIERIYHLEPMEKI